MKLGKAETCAHCGKQFKALLDKHDEQDCIDHLTRERDEARAEAKKYHDALVARHGGEPVALLEELDASKAEVSRLEGLILDQYLTMGGTGSTWLEFADEARRIRAQREEKP